MSNNTAQKLRKANDRQVKAVAALPTGQQEETVIEGPNVAKRALTATGHGLHAAGTAVSDFNLRKVGKGFKGLTKKLPKVQIVREA